MEIGEELFYMKHGTMELITLQEGKFKTVVIEEGQVSNKNYCSRFSLSLFVYILLRFSQVFLLPGKILHSPQRKEDTVGLVVERERASHELDCLRYLELPSACLCNDIARSLYPGSFWILSFL